MWLNRWRMVLSAALAMSAGAAFAQDGDCRHDDLRVQIDICSSRISYLDDPEERGVAYLYRCQAYDILGNYYDALADCKEARTLRSRDGSVHNSLSIVYQNLENYSAAIASATVAVTLKPDSGTYFNTRANAFCSVGRYEEAVDDRMSAMRNGAYSAETLQSILAEDGYYNGAIDGVFGSGSISALERWTRGGC